VNIRACCGSLGVVNAIVHTISLELSKYSAFRAISPKLVELYDLHGAQLREQPFLGGAPSRVLKRSFFKLAWYRNPPKKFSGGLILNVCGFQVLRSAIINRRLRVTTPAGRASDLLRSQGFEFLPQLIDHATAKMITNEYVKNLAHRTVYLSDFDELILHSPSKLIHNPNANNYAVKALCHLVESSIDYSAIYQQVVGTRLRCKPYISILRHRNLSDVNAIANLDGNTKPHSDVFFPSHKLFVYLCDIGRNDAPLNYWLGTHYWKTECSRRSLWKESVTHYLRRFVRSAPSSAESPSFASQALIGHLGDAVLFDVSGIHCRGEHLPGSISDRIVLLFDFRNESARRPVHDQV